MLPAPDPTMNGPSDHFHHPYQYRIHSVQYKTKIKADINRGCENIFLLFRHSPQILSQVPLNPISCDTLFLFSTYMGSWWFKDSRPGCVMHLLSTFELSMTRPCPCVQGIFFPCRSRRLVAIQFFTLTSHLWKASLRLRRQIALSQPGRWEYRRETQAQ